MLRRRILYDHVLELFPLRGFVRCKSCGRGPTGSWSKGRSEYYAYYQTGASWNRIAPWLRRVEQFQRAG
jgi:hypothetical protein